MLFDLDLRDIFYFARGHSRKRYQLFRIERPTLPGANPTYHYRDENNNKYLSTSNTPVVLVRKRGSK